MSSMIVEAPHSVEEFVKGYEESSKLRGFRCANCGLVTATWGLACSRCGRFPLDEAELSQRGKVVAFTILTVPGDEFLNDAPYAYVVVDLEGGGRVTGWMPSVKAENEISIGDSVHFVTSYKPGVQFAKDPPA
ncbi:MAG TPA: OB-fold domain-containing protein [Thermoplasmata archaeon]|nr:OB-fold domain-containing protein [Thermoplasmata archaeon]